LDRTEKESLVAALHEVFGAVNLVVVTRPQGLTVAESTTLRRQLKSAGANFKVTKNRLARLALKGTKFESLGPLFTGPTAIAFSSDPVVAAKIAVEFAEKNPKLEILGGGLNELHLDVQGVQSLAKLPSLDALRGKLIGLLQAPAGKIVGVLQAPGGQLARVLNAYATKEDAA